MNIVFASDHAGYKYKELLRKKLEENFFVKDFGTFSEDSCDYSDFAHPLALAVESGEFELGITLCGSGNGINMTVNKHQKIRGALCWNVEIAKLARLHNNANVCAIPARFVSETEAEAIMFAFINTGFKGGRHQKRIDKIPLC
jgi:ribose 5-phosphate isomerase B